MFRKYNTGRCLFLFFIFISGLYHAEAQQGRAAVDSSGIISRDSISKNGFTLIFINKDSFFDPSTKTRMIDAFFNVYPREVERFNKNSLTKVIFIIDPAYKGVAATGNGMARYSPKWMKEHPEDIDVVTHEVMHIVQAYPRRTGPGWLTEGIADYVRYKFGVNNEKGKWSLPAYDTSHRYTKSYRITARFLVWLEKQYPTIVNELDSAMRSATYTPEIWTKLTGKSIDDLWTKYGDDPTL
jgi:hypothetical protein